MSLRCTWAFRFGGSSSGLSLDADREVGVAGSLFPRTRQPVSPPGSGGGWGSRPGGYCFWNELRHGGKVERPGASAGPDRPFADHARSAIKRDGSAPMPSIEHLDSPL